MAFQKKTWVDRLTEFATRRIITNATTREETLVEVARAEGEIYEPGDAFNAETMNDLEDRINDAFEEVGKGVGVVDTYDNVRGMISRGEIEEETFVSITDDSDDDSIPAIAIDYDNTNSGMTATEVQGAIDELSTNLDTVKGNVIIQTPDTTYQVNGSYLLGYGDNTGLMRLRVPLNFVTKNTNYSVAYTNMGVDGIGSIPQSSISVFSKNKDCVVLSITHGSIVYAKVYAITSFYLTLTFA